MCWAAVHKRFLLRTHFLNMTGTTTDRCTLTLSVSPPHTRTHIHIQTLKCRVCICLSVGEVCAPQGTNSKSALWGQRGAFSLLESRRGILCETENSRLTETPHSCTATALLTSCTHHLLNSFSVSLNPFAFVVQMNLLVQMITKDNQGQTQIVWFSICKEVAWSFIDNQLASHEL